mmetsp:Transcript_60610/g.83183  ORF Transcript_60610/g.83183 Transcript_60610/m.83183 type:complete len:493 (-) Transcript_60610:81-1559(-)
MYQYVEPPWTKKQHTNAMKTVLALATEREVNGRGRCAPEGLNCTLSGSAEGVRAFCQALRDWNPIFNETDFKFTDGLPRKQRFKSLSIRKVDELVAYGLGGAKAPSLSHFSGEHLEADEYHAMLAEQNDNTVVIDVRNGYESAIGHFDPPKGGAKLIDPKMRHSVDFPRWLSLPETQKELNGKRVMMYCTGGIRCERASALLNAVTETTPGFSIDGPPRQLRGGVERYMKTFPSGGLWKGKNYTFDRRMVQVPEKKPAEELEKDVTSRCVCCRALWSEYRGKNKCSKSFCLVPVIVCKTCDDKGDAKGPLLCDLCREGHEPPRQDPDYRKLREVEELKRKEVESADRGGGGGPSKKQKTKRTDSMDDPAGGQDEGRRLFIGRLPLTVTATQLREALSSPGDGETDKGGKKEGSSASAASSSPVIQWIKDRSSGLFYGSAFVGMGSAEEAARVSAKGLKLNGKKLKVNLSPVRSGDAAWPPSDFTPEERPKVF